MRGVAVALTLASVIRGVAHPLFSLHLVHPPFRELIQLQNVEVPSGASF